MEVIINKNGGRVEYTINNSTNAAELLKLLSSDGSTSKMTVYMEGGAVKMEDRAEGPQDPAPPRCFRLAEEITSDEEPFTLVPAYISAAHARSKLSLLFGTLYGRSTKPAATAEELNLLTEAMVKIYDKVLRPMEIKEEYLKEKAAGTATD